MGAGRGVSGQRDRGEQQRATTSMRVGQGGGAVTADTSTAGVTAASHALGSTSVPSARADSTPKRPRVLTET
jgi:hypothetical protein